MPATVVVGIVTVTVPVEALPWLVTVSVTLKLMISDRFKVAFVGRLQS